MRTLLANGRGHGLPQRVTVRVGPGPRRGLPALAVATSLVWLCAADEAAPDDRVQGPAARQQIVAARSTEKVVVDGRLDDEVWQHAASAGGFVQSEPHQGEPATERTEVKVAYDASHLYVAAYCYDSRPSGLVVNNIRKDFEAGDQDSFAVILDTFNDRRNGYIFKTNVQGARADEQIANEGREENASWDAVWTVRTQRADDGWVVEMAIPFKSLRYGQGAERVWGINFSRVIRRKNEVAYWAPIPRSYDLTRLSLAGTLIGLPALDPGRDLRLKPYVAAKAVRETGLDAFDRSADGGLDLKYGITPSLTLDVTVRPDFAQVEADEQQVNLTQFSQFFPEKRDFFLENSGIFYVGDAARRRSGPTPTPDEDLLLFFSRRIGLTPDGRVIPIAGGARLTGHAGGVGLGALTIQTRATDGTRASNYTVVRARRNIFASSDVGGIFMARHSVGAPAGRQPQHDYNRVYGADANIRLFTRLDWSSYLVRTATPGVSGEQYAARSSVSWEGDFFHGKGGLLSLGRNFNNELGFFRRVGIRKWFFDTGVRPRPARLQGKGIREVHPHVDWSYYTDQTGRVIAKDMHNGLSFFPNAGGLMEFIVTPRFERVDAPFRLNRRIPPIPAGGYAWTEYSVMANTDRSRAVSLRSRYTWGGLWSGTQRTLQATVTLQASYRFAVSAGIQRTSARLEVPRAAFVTNLVTVRTNYSFSTNMFLDSLLQYDRGQRVLDANVRFNLIHRPLSDLFIVYNEQRFVSPGEVTPGRGVIVKFSRMMAF